MRDPVVCADGMSYERDYIQQWFSRGNNRSPITNAVLPHRTLIPNHALRGVIEDLKRRMPRVQLEQLKLQQSLTDTEAILDALSESQEALLQKAAKPEMQDEVADCMQPWRIRCVAIKALGQMGAPAAPHAKAIAAALADSDSKVSREAVLALGRIGGPEAAGAAAEILRSPDVIIRRNAAAALKLIGKPSSELVAKATSAVLQDSNSDVRRSAARVLCSLGDSALPYQAQAQVALFEDTDPAVRCAAVRALGHLGEQATPYAQVLAEKLKDPEKEVRLAAVDSLTQLENHTAGATETSAMSAVKRESIMMFGLATRSVQMRLCEHINSTHLCKV